MLQADDSYTASACHSPDVDDQPVFIENGGVLIVNYPKLDRLLCGSEKEMKKLLSRIEAVVEETNSILWELIKMRGLRLNAVYSSKDRISAKLQ